MKKNIIFMILLIISASSFSQQTKPSPALTKQDYLQKSKKQKVIAWSLLLGGFGLEALAVATAYETEIGANLVRAGFVANLASIPFFIAAHRNKKKGMHLSIKNEPVSQSQVGGFVYRSVPSLTLKISNKL